MRNEFGTYQGKVAFENVARNTIEIYWPEGNVLLDPGKLSPLPAKTL